MTTSESADIHSLDSLLTASTAATTHSFSNNAPWQEPWSSDSCRDGQSQFESLPWRQLICTSRPCRGKCRIDARQAIRAVNLMTSMTYYDGRHELEQRIRQVGGDLASSSSCRLSVSVLSLAAPVIAKSSNAAGWELGKLWRFRHSGD